MRQRPSKYRAHLLRRWLAVGLASAIVLAACAPEEEQELTEDDPEDVVDDADDEADADDDDADAADTGDDRMVVALDADVDLIEPHTFRSTAAYSVTASLYGELLHQVVEDRDGDGKVLVGVNEYEPHLAEDYTIDEDGTATFTIREDAAFADGSPVTADDFAYTMERSIEGPGYIGALLPFIHISSTDQITVEDEQTLVIEPDQPSPFFEPFMAFQVFGAFDRDRIQDEADPDDEWGFEYLEENPTASGPYQLEEFDRENRVVLEPNPNYPFADEVANSGVTVEFVPDSDQRALLVQSGELDLASGLSPRLLEELDADENVDVLVEPSSRLTYMGMNNEIAPMDDQTLRQAVSTAIPYDTLLNDVQRGYAEPAGNLVTSPMDTYAGDEIGTYEEDLEEAQSLLEESDYDGEALELAVRQSRAQEQEAATFIQDNLRQIGVEVEVNVLPDGEYSERLNAGELQMFIHDWFSWGEDPFYQMMFLVQSGAFTNHTSYANEEVDALIDEGAFELDPDRRAEISRQVQEILLEEAPMAFLYAPSASVAVGSDVCGGFVVGDTQVIQLDTLTRCD